MYAHHVPHTYFTLTPKQTNPPEACEVLGDFHVRPTGFEPATFRVGVCKENKRTFNVFLWYHICTCYVGCLDTIAQLRTSETYP